MEQEVRTDLYKDKDYEGAERSAEEYHQILSCEYIRVSWGHDGDIVSGCLQEFKGFSVFSRLGWNVSSLNVHV